MIQFSDAQSFFKYQLQQKLINNSKYQLYQGLNRNTKQSVLVFTIVSVNNAILERLLCFKADLVMPYQQIFILENVAYIVYEVPENSVFLLNYLEQGPVSEEHVWDWLEQLLTYYKEIGAKKLVQQELDLSLFVLIPQACEQPEEVSSVSSGAGTAAAMSASTGASSAAQNRYKLQYFGASTLFNEFYALDRAVDLNTQIDVYIIGKFLAALMSRQCLSQLKQQTPLQETENYYERLLPKAVICGASGIVSAVVSDTYSEILLQLLNYTQLDAEQRITLDGLLTHPMFSTALDKFNILSYNSFEIADFDVLKKIGEGGFGVVQLAKHKVSNQLIVLKSSTRVSIQRREAALLRNLAHPNVVRLYGDFLDREIHYIAMQYCESGDLLRYLQRNRKVAKELQLPWISQLCSAMYYMHTQKLMHRDLKPENVLISNNRLYISDFGISKEIVSDTNTIIGTPMYFSPEVFQRKNYSFPSDVYSLGLVLYNMLTGEHIYRNSPKEQVEFYNHKNYAKYIESKMVFVSRSFRTLVFNMLKYTPSERPTMEQICLQPNIQQYLMETGLPGALRNSILLSQRAKRANTDLSALFARQGGGVDAMVEKLIKFKPKLPDFFDAAVCGCSAFIRSSLNLPKTAFGAYISSFLGLEVIQKLQEQNEQLSAGIKIQLVKDGELEIDTEKCYFYIGPTYQYKKRSKKQFVFAISMIIEDSLTIDDQCCIVVNNMQINRSIQIKMNNDSVLAVQKIESSKHYKITGGVIFSDIIGICDFQKPFNDVFQCDSQLQLVGEYANHCYPMLFKDGRGYYKNEGLWDKV